MQADNKFKDDLARLAGGAMSMAAGMKQEAESFFRQQIEAVLRHMNVVSREEFDVVKEMAMTARLDQEQLKARIEDLEEQIKTLSKKSDKK